MESWPHAQGSPIHPGITAQAIYFIISHKKLWQYPEMTEMTDESRREVDSEATISAPPTPQLTSLSLLASVEIYTSVWILL